MKIGRRSGARDALVIAFILILAGAVRLYGISFGMPAMLDVDEPFFTMTGLKLLSGKTLNPGWFGHPGTTTIYVLAIIDICVFLFGQLTGAIPNAKAFGVMIFTDPAIVAMPSRLFFAFCGVLCVWLTYVVGRRVYGERAGQLGAAFLAINALHIQWSQVIRTDVQATVFMLLCSLWSIRIVRDGRLRCYLAASVCVGLAIATKWPAASFIMCPMAAAVLRSRQYPAEAGFVWGRLMLILVVALASLFIVSPYLLLDYRTALSDVVGEAASAHLGATGGTFFENMIWYAQNPFAQSMGALGLLFAIVGLGLSATRNRLALAVLVSGFAVFFFLLCKQSLVWTRWVVPLLPFASLFTAVGVLAVCERVRTFLGPKSGMVFTLVIGCAVAIPMALATRSEATERVNDTRILASAWIRQNLPENSSLSIEYFAFDLLRGQRRIYYPAGGMGCIYANEVLRGNLKYRDTDRWRGKRRILDLGTIAPDKLDSCHAMYAMITDYDRYIAEAAKFPEEIATYKRLMRGGTELKVFRPVPGAIGGPVVRIVKLAPLPGGRIL